jgi:hypothetical protein
VLTARHLDASSISLDALNEVIQGTLRNRSLRARFLNPYTDTGQRINL